MPHSRPWLQPQFPFNTVSNRIRLHLRTQKKGRILLLASFLLPNPLLESPLDDRNHTPRSFKEPVGFPLRPPRRPQIPPYIAYRLACAFDL